MFSIEASYLLFVMLSLSTAAYVGRRQGKEWALGVGMAMSLLSASWFEITVAGLPISVSMTVAIVLLSVYCLHSWRKIFWPLTLLDFLVGGMVAWNVIVDTQYGQPFLPTLAKAYGEWILPYAAGRYAFLHRGSLTSLAPWFVAVGCIIALGAMIESWTGINAWELLFHDADDRVTRTTSLRYGLLYRAMGVTRHPIFLGVILMLLTAWAGILIDSAGRNRRRVWLGIAALFLIVLGVVATVSRGPLLGLFATLAFFLAVKYRFVRWALIPTVVLAGFWATMNLDSVVESLDTNIAPERKTIVEVDNEQLEYTGTKNRIFVMRIYGPIVLKGGLIGYGTANTDQFPPNVPGLPSETRSRNRLRIVDNSFILIGLRLGTVGLLLFVSFFLVSIWECLSMRRIASTCLTPSGEGSPTILAAVLVGVGLEILTVYCDYDFVPWILFHFGVVNGLYLHCQNRLKRAG